MMKRLFIISCLLLLLVSCGIKQTQTYTFEAEIVEVRESDFVIKAESSDISLPQSYFPEGKLGDTIEVTFDGTIMESYPMQLGKIYGVKVVE